MSIGQTHLHIIMQLHLSFKHSFSPCWHYSGAAIWTSLLQTQLLASGGFAIATKTAPNMVTSPLAAVALSHHNHHLLPSQPVVRSITPAHHTFCYCRDMLISAYPLNKRSSAVGLISTSHYMGCPCHLLLTEVTCHPHLCSLRRSSAK